MPTINATHKKNPLKRRRRFQEISQNKARQGIELHAIRYVLYISLTLAVISMVLAYQVAV